MNVGEISTRKIHSIEEAIEDIKKGKMIIVCDDEQRENEGDLIAAAEHATPEMINFMATRARGLICMAITPERCQELRLASMVEENTSSNSTNFTVSVDLLGHGCTTGISTQDRAKTILAIVNPATHPSELGRPGHIFPIKAHPGGVLARPGHTEAAIEFPRLAGLYPAGILVEVMNEDGTMARFPELLEYSQKNNIKIVTIKQLIQYLESRNQ